MKKIFFLIIFLAFFFQFTLAASENDVCCERTLDGAWCQDALQSQCDSTYSVTDYTSCAYSASCQTGTCVNSVSGTCSEDITKAKCENEGGYIDSRPIEQIDSCKRVCCVIGDSTNSVSRTECSRIASEYGVRPTILEGLSAEECIDKAFSDSLGACVTQDSVKDCSHLRREDCQNLEGEFYEGVLCTAPGISDCSMTSKTTCSGPRNEDVYFIDSCSNVANIFDESKIGLQEYWTKMKTDYSQESYSGDCDFSLEGTMCKQVGKSAMCVDSSKCTFVNESGQTVSYNHGDTWCYNEGALEENIKIDFKTNEFENTNSRDKLEASYLNSNLPGSRYYLMECRNGEVVEEPCADYRNAVCKEGKITYPDSGKKINYAVCATNNYRQCFNITSKSECESPQHDCKWLGWGYRFDGKVIEYEGLRDNSQGQEQRDKRDEEQGSCVPLYSPGLNFWETGNDASSTGNMVADSSYCSMASAVEIAYFETKNNDDVGSKFSTRQSAQNCFAGSCFALPDYGLKNEGLAPYRGLYQNEYSIEEIHEGIDPPGDLSNDNYLSERRGYYCHKSGDENTTKTGKISNDLNCAESLSKRNDLPIFTNHGVWIDFLQERAKSMGDCGYKLASWGTEERIYGDPTSEVLTAEFQILNQQMEIEDSYEAVNIYFEDKRVDPQEYRPSGKFSFGDIPYYWRTTDWWEEIHPNQIPLLGNKN